MMLFIVADSLRYDFAEELLFGNLFNTESHTSLDIDRYPCTSCSLPTIVTGTPYSEHKCRGFKNEVKVTGETLFNRFDSYVTISRLLGKGPFYDLPAHRIEMFKPIEWNAETDNDDAIFRCILEHFDLVFYHSWLTHQPYGITNWCYREHPLLVNTENYLREHTLEENREVYSKGVKTFRSRVRLLDKMTDEPIIITSDHGELLGEEVEEEFTEEDEDGSEITKTKKVSKISHGIKYEDVDLPAIREVPLIVNRDVDLSGLESIVDIKEFLWGLADV